MHKRISPHGDEDHMGESANIIKNFKVNNIILNSGVLVDLEKELIATATKLRIPYLFAKKGDILKIDAYTFNVLSPQMDVNENDNSLVIYTNLYNKKFLFTGDISSKKEKK